jgi:ATP-binding cassette subfamily F protein 3
VSHDRHLINAIANKVLVLSNGRVEMFHGNYDDYQEVWQQRLQPTSPLPKTESYRSETISASKKSKEQKRLEAKWRNELHRKKAPLKKRLEDLEQIIEKTSGRLDELNHLLAKPDTYENGTDLAALNREYNELKKFLEGHSQQWEEAALELEVLEQSFWEDKTLMK